MTTSPLPSHRLYLKTNSGPLVTTAMPEDDAIALAALVRQHATGANPMISLPLHDGDWEFNCRHATAWRVVPNFHPTQP